MKQRLRGDYLLQKLGGRSFVGILGEFTPWLLLTGAKSEWHMPCLLQTHHIDSGHASGVDHLGDSIVDGVALLDDGCSGRQDDLVLNGADANKSFRSGLLWISRNGVGLQVEVVLLAEVSHLFGKFERAKSNQTVRSVNSSRSRHSGTSLKHSYLHGFP